MGMETFHLKPNILKNNGKADLLLKYERALTLGFRVF